MLSTYAKKFDITRDDVRVRKEWNTYTQQWDEWYEINFNGKWFGKCWTISSLRNKLKHKDTGTLIRVGNELTYKTI